MQCQKSCTKIWALEVRTDRVKIRFASMTRRPTARDHMRKHPTNSQRKHCTSITCKFECVRLVFEKVDPLLYRCSNRLSCSHFTNQASSSTAINNGVHFWHSHCDSDQIRALFIGQRGPSSQSFLTITVKRYSSKRQFFQATRLVPTTHQWEAPESAQVCPASTEACRHERSDSQIASDFLRRRNALMFEI